jgi:hypothetical protein
MCGRGGDTRAVAAVARAYAGVTAHVRWRRWRVRTQVVMRWHVRLQVVTAAAACAFAGGDGGGGVCVHRW